MTSLLLAALVIAAQPTPCPAFLVLEHSDVKIARAQVGGRDIDDTVVSVDVVNRGVRAQPRGIRQHIEILVDSKVAGSQSFASLPVGGRTTVSFHIQTPHVRTEMIVPPIAPPPLGSDNGPVAKRRTAIVAGFQYVSDEPWKSGDYCIAADDGGVISF